MTNAGLPVPPGFTIQTEACREYMRSGGKSRRRSIARCRARWRVWKRCKEESWAPQNPFLVSVRSGAMFSMPGMMDTILNLGLNDKSVEGLAQQSRNPRFAYDSYRRLIQMFGNVVLDIPKSVFEHAFDAKKKQRRAKSTLISMPEALQEVIAEYKKIVRKHAGPRIPARSKGTAWPWRATRSSAPGSTTAPSTIAASITSPTSGHSRQRAGMVFGNLGETSGTGVGFTRNPSTGKKEFFGEYPDECAG